MPGNGKKKKYLIALEETRSIVALIASIMIIICTMGAVFFMLDNTPDSKENALHYFTVWSNLFSAAGAAFMLPFAIEGIHKKRFVLPRWLVIFQYSGASCVAITMLSALCLILPVQGAKSVTGSNFWLHIIAPAFTVVLFQCVETSVKLRFKDMLAVFVPFFTYSLIYAVMVVFVGKENGGWSDFYRTMSFWPAWISFIMMHAVGFIVALVMRIIHNKLAVRSSRRIARMWGSDLEDVDLLVEAFGLGRYIGAHCSVEELTVPLDIFEMMSDKYGIPLDKLTKAYVKGAVDAVKERRIR